MYGRFYELFTESFPSLPWLQGPGQQDWYINGILRKQFPKPTVQVILSEMKSNNSDLFLVPGEDKQKRTGKQHLQNSWEEYQ